MVAFLVFVFTTAIAITFGVNYRLRGRRFWSISEGEGLLRVLIPIIISIILNICIWWPLVLVVLIIVALVMVALAGCVWLTAWLTKRFLK